MEIISAHDPNAITHVLKVLRHGGVVVYPTETAYGLGGDWTKPSVHRRIRLIKGRERGKPLSVVVPSLSAAKKYVNFSPTSLMLAKKHWPGPLSLVLPLKHALPFGQSGRPLDARRLRGPAQEGIPLLRRGAGVGALLSLRLTSHPIAHALVKKLGTPLIATSANVSGKETLYDAQEIVRVFARRKHKPDVVIDAGRLKRVKPSTVVAMEGGSIRILRQGPVKINPKP